MGVGELGESEWSGHCVQDKGWGDETAALPTAQEEEGGGKVFPSGPVARTPHSQCKGTGSIPGQGTRSHMLELGVYMPQLKIRHAAITR